MSRGNREITQGILKHSMRDNYSEHGVEEYYRKVGATYRNPHFPGVKTVLWLWFNRLWAMEGERIGRSKFNVFDMACGSGEATLSFIEWWQAGQKAYDALQSPAAGTSNLSRIQRKPVQLEPPPLSSELKRPSLFAADPFTAEALHARTGMHNCSNLSFRDVAEGMLPASSLSSVQAVIPGESSLTTLEMTICSFALHLVESQSELFSLLWELSTKCRWLIVVAPHKKPEIKEGWGWMKWNVDSWNETQVNDTKGEMLRDRCVQHE
ncbi:uncharacterized protein PHACADRAFT_261735 [Phanerochaete carnosa HHB-10118-sp]|uniref:Uncharacterized protein n=1 Tax=Phanerochaete carnosa (strain HHB-10118-sp) TaxID=650164 RepID=K5UP44_PHACS|nr:uncharacterized protein PHACADRAFT_261735 [Phanerochaete carnosa HHB-10118-sp]EKM51536.1 hypothetical protein PHACADRAFT_261735 [Phanerochaete carnosa HHB-10118-sp]